MCRLGWWSRWKDAMSMKKAVTDLFVAVVGQQAPGRAQAVWVFGVEQCCAFSGAYLCALDDE